MDTRKILIAYATHYGSTRQAAEEIVTALRETGLEAEAIPAHEVQTLENYKAVVIGSPLEIGKWRKEIHQFLGRFREELMERPVAVFALGPIHNKEEEITGAREQMAKELSRHAWLKPVAVETFVGKFDPSKLQFPASLFMKAIPYSDEMDHAGIRAWALRLPQMLMLTEAALPLETVMK